MDRVGPAIMVQAGRQLSRADSVVVDVDGGELTNGKLLLCSLANFLAFPCHPGSQTITHPPL